MDDSLRSLVNETQTDNEDDEYIMDFNFDHDTRQKYSIICFLCCLILNIILIVNINFNIFINIFLCILNNLFLLLPIIISYKKI